MAILGAAGAWFLLSVGLPSGAYAATSVPLSIPQLSNSSSVDALTHGELPRFSSHIEIPVYTVQDGDTLWSIGADHGLTLDTIRFANPDFRRNPDILLSIGQHLRIPPVNGALHDVVAGDTVESIATRWNVTPAQIRGFVPNGLTGDASTRARLRGRRPPRHAGRQFAPSWGDRRLCLCLAHLRPGQPGLRRRPPSR